MSLPLPPSHGYRRRGRRPAAAAAAVTVVLVLVILVLLPRLSRPASRQAPGGVSPSSQQATHATSSGRVPAGTPGTIAVSTAGWRAVNLDGTEVPLSQQAGPQQGPWPLAAGFADTPAGAVLAAVNIAARTSGQLGSAIFNPTIAQQVTGPGAGALLSAAEEDYATAARQNPPTSTGGPAGTADASARAFQLTSWTAVAADIEVLAGANNASGPGAVVHLQVRWLDGDWRLVAPASGVFAANAAQADLRGFTPLPGS
jgi:hypothetical protein